MALDVHHGRDHGVPRRPHSNRPVVVLEMLGESFAGIVVSDCLAIYDDLPYRTHKCIAHHQKAIARARDRPDTAEPSYLQQWKLFFTMVTMLWRYRVTPDVVRSRVLEGADEANSKFGTSYHPWLARSAVEDYNDECFLLRRAAYCIVERVAEVGESGYEGVS